MFPDVTVLWALFLVLLAGVMLNGLIVAPLKKVMDAREQAVKSARELAESAASQAQAASADFSARIQAARDEIYREMEEKRRQALDRRAQLLAATRAEAEAEIREATERIKNDTVVARARLEQDATALAADITERMLGRKAS